MNDDDRSSAEPLDSPWYHRPLNRLRSVRDDLRSELEAALAERHTPRQVAGSFALGVFITALPTLGTGLLLFLLIISMFASVSKLALFASVLVLNPAVKWGVYGASFWLGSVIMGPVDGVTRSDLSLSAAPEIVSRLVVGNVILAVAFSLVGYVVAYRLMAAYRRRSDGSDALEEVLE